MKSVDLIGQRVLVAGLGITGRSVARWLDAQGVAFDVMDARASAAELPVGAVLHADLDVALSRHYEVIVLSPGIARAHPAIRAALAAGSRVIGDIELFASAVAVPVVAVTGSNGKSTVVAWLAEALVAAGVHAVPCGNIGDAALDALAADAELYVLELSSYQLESTDSLAPLAAIVLNVSEDHLDRYDGLADYAATKRRILAHAEYRLINVADAESRPAGTRRSTDILIDVSGGSQGTPAGWHLGASVPGHVSGASGTATPAGTRLVPRETAASPACSLCHAGRPLLETDALALPGQHNRFNALAVLALASVALERLRGTDQLPGSLLSAVAGFAGLSHRTEFVADIDGVRWYDDSKGTNVAACLRAIEAMPGPVVLIAGGQGKGADFAPIARQSARLRAAVLIGRDAPLVAAALSSSVPVRHCATLEAAVDSAARLARPGDAVLLSPACASFDMFDDFAARGRAFQDAVRLQRVRPASVGGCR